MPPQENATVTGVTGAGTADDWDRAGAAGPSKWAGTARAYYRERADRQRDGIAVNIFTRRELIVETAALELMALDTDDVITFRVDGAAADSTGTAKTIRRSKLDGIPPDLQTALIVLEDA